MNKGYIRDKIRDVQLSVELKQWTDANSREQTLIADFLQWVINDAVDNAAELAEEVSRVYEIDYPRPGDGGLVTKARSVSLLGGGLTVTEV